MAKKDRIKELEAEKGKPLDTTIVGLVNAGGQALAAHKLGISQSAISRWLKDNGYVSRTYWQKGVTEQERADIEAAHDRVNAKRVAEGRPTLEEEEQFS
jgi:hypothetical protein